MSISVERKSAEGWTIELCLDILQLNVKIKAVGKIVFEGKSVEGRYTETFFDNWDFPC